MKSINVDGSDESSDWIHFMRFDSEDGVKGDKVKKSVGTSCDTTTSDKKDTKSEDKTTEKIEINIKEL